MCNIMAIRIDRRSQNAGEVQNILTKYGFIIKLRIGCHETYTDSDMEDGIVLLHLNPNKGEEVQNLKSDLDLIEGVTVKALSI